MGFSTTSDEIWIYFRQVDSKLCDASWISEDESAKTVVHEDRFEAKLCFVYSLKQMPLFLYIVWIKARL